MAMIQFPKKWLYSDSKQFQIFFHDFEVLPRQYLYAASDWLASFFLHPFCCYPMIISVSLVLFLCQFTMTHRKNFPFSTPPKNCYDPPKKYSFENNFEGKKENRDIKGKMDESEL